MLSARAAGQGGRKHEKNQSPHHCPQHFCSAAALSATALAAGSFDCADSASLKTALDGSVSGDAINLTANSALASKRNTEEGRIAQLFRLAG